MYLRIFALFGFGNNHPKLVYFRKGVHHTYMGGVCYVQCVILRDRTPFFISYGYMFVHLRYVFTRKGVHSF